MVSLQELYVLFTHIPISHISFLGIFQRSPTFLNVLSMQCPTGSGLSGSLEREIGKSWWPIEALTLKRRIRVRPGRMQFTKRFGSLDAIPCKHGQYGQNFRRGFFERKLELLAILAMFA